MSDDSSISASGLNIEIIYRGSNLLDFTYKPNEEGVWHLEVLPNGQSYSTEISAICTFNFLSDFDYLDLNTTHPSMQTLPGQPISSKYYVKTFRFQTSNMKTYLYIIFIIIFFRFNSIY